MDILQIMTEYSSEEQKRIEGTFGDTCLVYCPSYCEEEFTIATVENGRFISQGDKEDITEYVEKYLELEQFL